MLFQKNIFMCDITRDSDFAIGKKLDLSISFGGNSSNSNYSSYFNKIKEYGIIPLSSIYLETIISKDKLDIVYYTSEYNGDSAKEFIKYRKVSIPSYIRSCSELDEYIIKNVGDYICSKYSLDKSGFNIFISKTVRPEFDEVSKGVNYLRSADDKYKGMCKPSCFVYCSVNGVECILSIFEGTIRGLELLPIKYDFEYLVMFWRIISSYSDETIIEFVSTSNSLE